MICRECGRAYHPESYGDPVLSLGGWDDRYSEWSGRYCLPCTEKIAADETARHLKYRGTHAPCPQCGGTDGCTPFCSKPTKADIGSKIVFKKED